MEIKTRQWRPEQMLLVSALREGFGPQVGSDLGRAMEAERTIIQAQHGRIRPGGVPLSETWGETAPSVSEEWTWSVFQLL